MNILILSTYPIKNPAHGGQIRVSMIVKSLIDAGHNVEVVGVLGSQSYADSEGFIAFPGYEILSTFIENPFLMEDVAIGLACRSNDGLYRSLASKIRNKPDLIHCEHPWLFGFAIKYRAQNNLKSKIIYSSHNIEHILKRKILEKYLDDELANKYGENVLTMEREAIKGCDGFIAVSQSDADYLCSFSKVPNCVLPNGVSEFNPSPADMMEAIQYHRGARYALYCASAHPPNIEGFFSMFAGGFGSLKPDEILVVAGQAGWSIIGDDRVHKSARLAEKVVNAGLLSRGCLDALILGAHCIVLPITEGGGTNLKTAEAIFSGKYIVGTTVSFRGFEKFADLPQVFLADDPMLFKRQLRVAMSKPPKCFNDKTQKLSEREVLWEKTLSGLNEFVKRFNK